MAKKYTLHYLSDKEFDNLPYKHVKTSFGCADEKTGNAYVRRTGIRPIDEFVTEHEIAELVAKVSPHEEDGIRYKAPTNNLWNQLVNSVTGEPQSKDDRGLGTVSPSGQISKPTGSSAGFGAPSNVSTSPNYSNPYEGTVTGSLGASAPTTPANTSTINQPATSGLNKAFENYQSNQLGFANTPLKMGGTTNNVSPNLQTINAPSSAPQTSFSSPNSIANMFTTSQASNFGTPLTLGGKTSNVTGGTEGLTATPTNAPTVNTPAINSATASSLGFETPSKASETPITDSVLNQSKSIKANVPLQTINQAAASPSIQTGGETSATSAGEQTKTPFLESIFGKDWRQTLLGQGLKTAAGLGVAGIGQAMAGKPQTVNPQDSALFNQVVERVQSGAQVEMTPAQRQTIESNYNQQLDNARNNIIERFKRLRPGSDISNDSQLQQALIELENDFAEQKANAITAAQLGLTQQQTAQLSQLAAADINYLSQVAGISNQEAADFKKMMADFGGMIAQGGQKQQVVYLNKE